MSTMKRVLGIDHGEARIGVAISDELGMLAHAVVTLSSKENPLQKIEEICARESVTMIVLGMPRNMNGTYGPAAEKAKAFAEELRAQFPCEVVFWDERLTSVAAQRALHETGRNAKQSRSVIDQVAAQMILQSYLDSKALALD